MAGGPAKGFAIAKPLPEKLAIDRGLLYGRVGGAATKSSSSTKASSSA